MDKQSVETTVYSLDDALPEPQRRSSERHLSLFRVGAITIGDRRELCLIKNISAGGMLIRAYSAIDAGSRLSVELKQGEIVSGTVQWTKDGCVGVSFDAPIDVLSLLTASPIEQRPRMPRIEVNCTAWIREGATVHRTRLINVSQGGICVETPAALTVGAEVVATLNGLPPEPAVVRWSEGKSHGVGFNHVLSLSQLVAWLQEQRGR